MEEDPEYYRTIHRHCGKLKGPRLTHSLHSIKTERLRAQLSMYIGENNGNSMTLAIDSVCDSLVRWGLVSLSDADEGNVAVRKAD